jgi:hypothetical protein
MNHLGISEIAKEVKYGNSPMDKKLGGLHESIMLQRSFQKEGFLMPYYRKSFLMIALLSKKKMERINVSPPFKKPPTKFTKLI